MGKSKPQPTLTDVLRAAIQKSGLTLYRIGNATDIDPTNLGRFVRGELYIRLDKADRLAAYLGLRLTPDPDAVPPEPTPENLARPMLATETARRRGEKMKRKIETQESRVARIKAYLKTKPGKPCDIIEIGKATGIAKCRIDYKESLSSDSDIRREKRKDSRGKNRVYWSYVGKLTE